MKTCCQKNKNNHSYDKNKNNHSFRNRRDIIFYEFIE